jgi:hypothetical protein
MGRITKGILGGFSGKVGTVVGGSWKGIDFIRSRSGARKSPPTPRQEQQRAKFALAIRFLNTLSGLLSITFSGLANQMTGPNNALSYTLKHAITGVYPALAIDFSMVRVARGSLPNAPSATASSPAPGQIRFNWSDNSGVGNAKADDAAVLVAYCEARQEAVYTTIGAGRAAETDTLAVLSFRGTEVHTWLSFLSSDGKEVASSVYTGAVNVGPGQVQLFDQNNSLKGEKISNH